MSRGAPRQTRQQQGAATLIVVMVLFFVMSLVAAYTNRSLIFEQRTSTNQYRSTQALEVADSGLEWVLAQLNFERITNQCLKSSVNTNTSFRQRYLNIAPATGKILPVPDPVGGGELTPSCVWTGIGSGWSCSCPSTGAPALTAPTAAGVWPAFRVRFRPILLVGTPLEPKQPSAVWVDVVGCTRLDAAGASDPCLNFDGQGTLNEGRAVVSSILTLTGNAAGLPQAALTAFGPVNVGGAALGAYNTQPNGSGITVHAGGAIAAAGLVLRSSPGTPGNTSFIQSDPLLDPLVGLAPVLPFSAAERMFASVFSMRPETFRTQPAAVQLTCSPCTAATVRTELAANPGRPLWLTGSLSVDSAGDIGSAAAPALIVVNGALEYTGAGTGANLYGLLYTRLTAGGPTSWVTSGSGQVTGAVVAEGGVTGAGTPTIVYDPDVLRLVRFNIGSFVRVAGSWTDFR